jgi:hypothetical protein
MERWITQLMDAQGAYAQPPVFDPHAPQNPFFEFHRNRSTRFTCASGKLALQIEQVPREVAAGISPT